MDGGEFEWDEAKARSNLAKHEVSFEAARLFFDDVFALDRFGLDNDPGETRYVITGLVNGVMWTVFYAERDDRTRIISARKATRSEEDEYYRSQTAQ
jgi:uncharacterized DUF497 family protein